MKKYLCRRTFAKGCRSPLAITPPRQVASEPSHPRATAAVSRVCRREKRSTAMPDTGSPPGPPAELAGSQPWPGFDKFSAVQVGRPSRFAITPSPRVSTALEPNHEPSEGKPARLRGGGRPRASPTRALDPTKCPTRHQCNCLCENKKKLNTEIKINSLVFRSCHSKRLEDARHHGRHVPRGALCEYLLSLIHI